jgi:hypothetical protein
MNRNFRELLSAFSGESVEYLIAGAYALAAHGVPRATGDLDVWIRPSAENAERVFRALATFGAPLTGMTEEDFRVPGAVFQIGVPPQRIDVLTLLDGISFEQAWTHRTEVDLSGLKVPVIGRADLIRNKRAVGRPQDLADVARLEDQAQ